MVRADGPHRSADRASPTTGPSPGSSSSSSRAPPPGQRALARDLRRRRLHGDERARRARGRRRRPAPGRGRARRVGPAGRHRRPHRRRRVRAGRAGSAGAMVARRVLDGIAHAAAGRGGPCRSRPASPASRPTAPTARRSSPRPRARCNGPRGWPGPDRRSRGQAAGSIPVGDVLVAGARGTRGSAQPACPARDRDGLDGPLHAQRRPDRREPPVRGPPRDAHPSRRLGERLAGGDRAEERPRLLVEVGGASRSTARTSSGPAWRRSSSRRSRDRPRRPAAPRSAHSRRSPPAPPTPRPPRSRRCRAGPSGG